MSKREQSALAQAQPNVSNLVVDNVHAVTKGLDVVTFSSSVFSPENFPCGKHRGRKGHHPRCYHREVKTRAKHARRVRNFIASA